MMHFEKTEQKAINARDYCYGTKIMSVVRCAIASVVPP